MNKILKRFASKKFRVEYRWVSKGNSTFWAPLHVNGYFNENEANKILEEKKAEKDSEYVEYRIRTVELPFTQSLLQFILP